MAPAAKKQRVESDEGAAAASYSEDEAARGGQQSDVDDATESDEEDMPMSIIAQFQSEDVRRSIGRRWRVC